MDRLVWLKESSEDVLLWPEVISPEDEDIRFGDRSSILSPPLPSYLLRTDLVWILGTATLSVVDILGISLCGVLIF